MKYLDVDNVYLKSIVDKSVGDDSYCESHEDCDLFDCKGFCNLIENKCQGGVTNNNLQVVCEKIFLGGQSKVFSFLDSSGLLVLKHANKGLKEAVELCANPSKSESLTRIAADDSIFQDLRKKLREIVSIHNKLGSI